MKNPAVIKFLIILLVILGLWFGYAVYTKGQQHTDDAFIEAKVVPIIPRVSGYVTELYANDNAKVKRGDRMLQIDPEDFRLRVDKAKAMLAASDADWQNTKINLERQMAMGNLSRSKKELDDAVTAELAAKANYNSAKADLEQANRDHAFSNITAPDDGVVTMRGVEKGAFVAAGQRLFALVTPQRWVVANFKESQIEHMKAGDKVKIEVDAYPDLKLEGHVESIMHGTGSRFSAFPAENATGNFVKVVQRVPVKILIDSKIPDGVVLAVGLSVIPTVYTNGK
jgi:membrane fusion protein, multidrug efflux system